VEILKSISIDWLGKKWFFFISSWALIALGALGYFLNDGLMLGIDFTGGTVVYAKFKEKPDFDRIRESLSSKSETPPLIQTFGDKSQNEVQIRMQTFLGGSDLQSGKQIVLTLLRKGFDSERLQNNQADFNNVVTEDLYKNLLAADPDNLKTQNKTTNEMDQYYRNSAQKLISFRDKDRKGLIQSMDDLKKVAGLSGSTFVNLDKNYYAGPVTVKGVHSIGAIVGSDLRRRAAYAVGFSFLGMLIYIGFRFKPIYGVAAVFAVLHDVIITVGLFALTQKEISLTVIAALLTLIGYSMNDTIVIFDRARENLRLLRKESLYNILNLSINQTLARTIITSGFTFLAVISLFLFGGEVLNGFSFALVIGIIIGTYSTMGIASPIVEWWYRYTDQKSKR
jgi:preprotein translocase subunit SecF